MKVLRILFLFSLMISINQSGQLRAQTNTGAHQHEDLFLRFMVGLGPGKITHTEFDGSKTTFKAATGIFHIQFGAPVLEKLIFFGDVGGFTLINPKVKYQGITESIPDDIINAVGYGLGATYYFMPANIFLSASILSVNDYIEHNGEKLHSDNMIGYFISAGKEWWIADNWSAGVAVFYETNTSKNPKNYKEKADISNNIFGVMFSVTMD